MTQDDEQEEQIDPYFEELMLLGPHSAEYQDRLDAMTQEELDAWGQHLRKVRQAIDDLEAELIRERALKRGQNGGSERPAGG